MQDHLIYHTECKIWLTDAVADAWSSDRTAAQRFTRSEAHKARGHSDAIIVFDTLAAA